MSKNNTIADKDMLITFPQETDMTLIETPDGGLVHPGSFKCMALIDMFSPSGKTMSMLKIKFLTTTECNKLSAHIGNLKNTHESNLVMNSLRVAHRVPTDDLEDEDYGVVNCGDQ